MFIGYTAAWFVNTYMYVKKSNGYDIWPLIYRILIQIQGTSKIKVCFSAPTITQPMEMIIRDIPGNNRRL